MGMSTNIDNTKKEIRYFLLINLALIALVSIFIFMAQLRPDGSMFIMNFGGTFMYIPALAVVIVLKNVSKYEFTPKVDKFLRVFKVTAIVRIIVSIAELLIFNYIMLSSLIDTIISMYLVCVVMYNDIYHREEFEVLNLSISKNFKKVLLVILIFLSIRGIGIVAVIMTGEASALDMSNTMVLAVMAMFTNFLFGFNLFFGEEFGWRYFLQPRLQKIYGKKCGVFILGFIWGIWHLPLCFTLYSPQTPIYCVISHIAYCMLLGVFLGYTYMKTENIWAPILIHLVNNSMSVIFAGGYESVMTLETLLMSIVVNAIVFLPFLLTKEYKSNNIEESSI